ncbi:hypothetical protein GGI17_002074 [Coemansia sp. S146]|nr:hypothetical protein GGI17_002074 [Coemansia sp. S146]
MSASNTIAMAVLPQHQIQHQHRRQPEALQKHQRTLQHQPSFAREATVVELPPRKYLLPPIYPCHYKLQRAGYMGIWTGLHVSILAYFLAINVRKDWTEGLNLASQYGILTSVMGILLAMSPTFLGLLRRTALNRVLTFEKRTHAHKFMSYILFVWTIAHSSLHYWTGVGYADSIHVTHTFIFWEDRLGATGQMMWMFFLFIGLAALPVVRRLYYEVFYYIHHLYLVNIALLYVHSENGKAIRYVTGPLAIFVLDYLYRSLRSYPLIWSRRARIRYIKFHPGDVVEVGFDRRELLQHTRVGQYVKICVPELGIFQWHPFTLTATPSESRVMADGKSHGIWRIHFKVAGDWTHKLSKRLHKVAAGGDSYNNNFDQEARIGRVVNDVIVPEVLPIRCPEAECEEDYIMALASRLDSGDSAISVKDEQVQRALTGIETRPPALATATATATPDASVANDSAAILCEAASPLGSDQACRVPLAPMKSEFDGTSFLSSSSNSTYDDVWFDPEFEGSRRQAMLPTILVDGPYSAPMESFFEYHANIIVAAGIGITPYIAALDRVLEMCADNIPARTTQTTREELLPSCIYLVWVFRDISLLCVMLPALQRLRANHRAREIVVPCLYVTGAVDAEHETAASDVFGRPMVRLANGIRVSLGRPPIARMMAHMAGKHPNSKVGVFSCAPKKMTALVRSTVHDTNAAVAHQGTHIEMRAECFSM